MINQADKMISGERLRILFLNDNGFQYGAGIAELRQIQSLLLLGHEIYGICWQQGKVEESISFMPPKASGNWRGMTCLSNLDGRNYSNRDAIVETLLEEVTKIGPDLVITGNLHGSGWPLELLPVLHEQGYLVVAYMHDCYYITGRCTHPFSCRSFISGCNEQCDTVNEHPFVPPAAILYEWNLRRDIFSKYPGIALVANSQWTLHMAKSALVQHNYIDMVHLGLDHHLFSPISKTLARRVLGLPENAYIIITGAVNVKDPHKGGWIFEEIVRRLSGKVVFLVFGQAYGLDSILSTGLIRDYRKMPLLYSAADLFVGTSLAESFGQTYCEAAACGLPIVAFRIGGIPDIARHNINARLVDEVDIETHLKEIHYFMNNPGESLRFGAAGRRLVETEFTLEEQAMRWRRFFAAFGRHFQGQGLVMSNERNML